MVPAHPALAAVSVPTTKILAIISVTAKGIPEVPYPFALQIFRFLCMGYEPIFRLSKAKHWPTKSS
ncbi:hypothetical protein EON83_17815 [bacterium]|nr:MAG: hypothetical protein EON83_17815 [bacterium]